jgi:diguanylate cyclase (GGDEF)-like protein/PAS domain S-box-containing protein
LAVIKAWSTFDRVVKVGCLLPTILPEDSLRQCSAAPASLQAVVRCRSRLFRTAFLLLLCGGALFGQWQKASGFASYGSEAGLRQNSVTALAEDRHGFIWIGTQDGLHRFDGARFEVFSSENSALPGSFISALCLDGSGRLWVGTLHGGLALYQGGDRFLRYTAESSSLNENSILSLSPRSEGGIWVLMPHALQSFDGGERWETLRQGANLQCFFEGNGTTFLAEDSGFFYGGSGDSWHFVCAMQASVQCMVEREGVLFLGTQAGLLTAEPPAFLPRPMEHPLLARAHVRTLHHSSDGLWVGTFDDGLFFLPAQGGPIQHHQPSPGLKGQLQQGRIISFTSGSDGTIWVGTGLAGLFSYHPERTRFQHFYYAQAASGGGIASNLVRALHPDGADGLYLGTDGAGILHLSSLDEPIRETPQMMPAHHRRIWSFAEWQGHLLAGGDEGLLRKEGDRWQEWGNLKAFPVRTLLETPQRLLVGSFGKGLGYFEDTSDNLHLLELPPASDARIMALLSVPDGAVLVGTLGELLLWQHDGSLQTVSSGEGMPVRTLLLDGRNQLWVGTARGLYLFAHGVPSQPSEPTRVYTEEDGLPNSTIYALEEDDSGRIWLSTNRGIACLDGGTNALLCFDTSDGLQAMEFNGGASARDGRGTLYFGGIQGFNAFRPMAIQPTTQPASVAFSYLETVLGSKILSPDSAQSIVLTTADAFFRVGVTTLDFAHPQRSRFRYRLLGYQEDWIEGVHRSEITYTGVPPGPYQLQVQATNRDGLMQPGIHSLAFEVAAPPWRSRPALFLYLAGLLALSLFLLSLAYSLRKSHKALKQSEDRLRWALWGSGDGLWDWDMRSGIVHRSRFAEWLGYGNEELREPVHIRRGLIHADDREAMQKSLEQHLKGEAPYYEATYRLRSHDGSWKWVLDRGRVVERDADGTPWRMAGTHKDIGQQIAMQERLDLAWRAIESTEEAVVLLDQEFRLISANPAFEALTAFLQVEVQGKALRGLLSMPPLTEEAFLLLISELRNRDAWKGEIWLQRKDKEPFLAWAHLNAVRASRFGTHFVMVFSDITQRKRSEEELRWLANYDTLTRLPNRTFFMERLNRAILRAQRGHQRLALLFLDLDRFKHINDSLGHNTGDALLCSVADRLRNCVRKDDTTARLGGDEFTIILERLENPAGSAHVAEKILADLAMPFSLGPYELVVSPSIGISIFPEDGCDAETLLRNADTAMYSAKAKGRNNYQYYSQEMNSSSLRRLEREAALRFALPRAELELHYQPQVDLTSGFCTACEALLRWRSPQFGMVSPLEFIPIAEDNGLIVEIGDWVLQQALYDFQQWRTLPGAPQRVAINLSPRQVFSNDFLSRTRSLIAASGLPGTCIEFELTESLLLDVSRQNIQTMAELKGMGATLALDDFGTGYSSLSYLKRFPMDTLKVDRSFIQDLEHNEDTRSLVGSILAMGKRMGLTVVAEGIESAEQARLLFLEGCHLGQGYHFARPMPDSDLRAWLSARLGPHAE